MDDNGSNQLDQLGKRSKQAAQEMAKAATLSKNEALSTAADAILALSDEILEANALDVERAGAAGAVRTSLDRLMLNENRIASMAGGLREVAKLPDPVGEIAKGWQRPNGLLVTKVRVPLGVIGIVYENRPNVTADAAGLCLKAGNAVMLRGSSAALGSNKVIARILRQALSETRLPQDALILVEDPTRESVKDFVQLSGVIDCLIPRGGAGLVNMVRAEATVPLIIDGDGNCHVYVDASADLDMALEIVDNAKTSRPSVCNAAETLLVHKDVATYFLPRLVSRIPQVELLGDAKTCAILPGAVLATEKDYATEFLDLKMTVAVVNGLDEAIEHITRYGTGHSEAIITNDLVSAERFCREVDAAAVLVNASTRFVDGGEFGLGAEIGISTQKLHARGPMGLEELTCLKYVVHGQGQVRT
ncbi:MAG: glutamate-5-semialdehyde dehydrogenase [Actinobacteria bacterium]|nr:glutamate-5-semialdehyde dehydrogenase [Actinomycetota bacterium]MCL6105365.1 glutamate-5-semialdehyde dehydrogenase [Actinomycetota bacterium]